MPSDLGDLEKEKEILQAVRKTLAQVVVDVTPDSSALRSPLKPQTIEDIRMCFGLISARERELMDTLQRNNNDRPHFVDELEKSRSVVHFSNIKGSVQKKRISKGDV